jgi:hypothetical protein
LSLDYLRSFCKTEYSLLAFQFVSNFVVFLLCGPSLKELSNYSDHQEQLHRFKRT